ncbi:sterile alpha motif domain-containing protein 9-like [Orbicella faveolata]|uniref:sterile alpha motif domain-containing protein 9-like n=1 Tax=Orbicella faveolata TaxID=48498 RepID=UPI0009E5C9C6|nr:sterile alpha motif domain-containing protein 9-like [Orbicella faveolata]
MTRQALWDFRCNPQFPYRCAVVTKIDGSTSKELLQLRKIGYGEESEAQSPPVLALVEDTDDFLFREFRSQVVEHANKLPRTHLPVCVFLYCKPTQKPLDCHLKEPEASVFLEQHLSQKEVDWFKDKCKDMKRESRSKDPEHDFENYANENLISFMVMKENYNPKYTYSVVQRNLDLVIGDELTLLKYLSLLNLYNPNPVFSSCFDTLMLSDSLRKRICRDWVEDLTHSARIFLREVDCSTHSGSGKAIAIVHPIIACELLDQIAVKNASSVSKITLDFLESSLLESQPTRFTSKSLFDGANRMLKNRKKFENGDDEQTKFSPLIEKILYVKDAGDGEKKATEQSIHEAAEVLRKGLDKFQDSMLAQQMARVFYVNAGAFSESRIDECFDHALTFCKKAIEMNPNNSFLFDTMGRIHEAKMKILYGPIRKDNRIIEISTVTPVLPLAFEAMKWFKKSQAVSMDYQNMCGVRGELSVIFYLLDVLRCTGLFRGEEGLKKIQGYLAYRQVIPPDVDKPWREFHEAFRDLKNRFSNCMEGLAEEFTIYKGNSAEAILLPKQIAWFKAQYHTYFGEGDLKWNLDIPEERWENRWQQINQYLAGDVFSSVFKIDRALADEEKPEETLQVLNNLAHENDCETIHPDRYKDLLLYITSCMALHSPYGNRSNKKSDFAKLIQEYKEIYKFVDQLLSIEIADEGYKRLYAHLLKVMFLWPRKDLELNDCRVQDFYEALRKLQKRWESKRKRCIDTDKMLKQNVYKYMPFKEETRQYTTLFYLGKGTGLDVFVHTNELAQSSRGSIDWRDRRTKSRLERLTGVVESRNIIRLKNPLDQSRMIDVYYSSFREGGFSKEEVSFFLGFSWQGPIALDVKYTNSDHVKHSAESSDAVLGDQFPLSLPKYIVTYEEYTSRMGKLLKKLGEIDSLKRKKKKGDKLDENQEKKISKEVDFKRQLQELKQSLDALGVLEEEIIN